MRPPAGIDEPNAADTSRSRVVAAASAATEAGSRSGQIGRVRGPALGDEGPERIRERRLPVGQLGLLLARGGSYRHCRTPATRVAQLGRPDRRVSLCWTRDRSLTAADLPQRLIRLGFRPDDLTDALAARAGRRRRRRDHPGAGHRGAAPPRHRGSRGSGRDRIRGPSADAYRRRRTPAGVLPMLALIVDRGGGRGLAADAAGSPPRSRGPRWLIWVSRSGCTGMTYGELRAAHRGLAAAGLVRRVLLARSAAVQPAAGSAGTTGRVGAVHPHPADRAAHPGGGRRLVRLRGPLLRAALPGLPDQPTSTAAAGCSTRSSSTALPAASNIAQFGRRWRLYGEPMRRGRGRAVLHLPPPRQTSIWSRCRATPPCSG